MIAGANGSGESSIYGSLRLLADAALNSVVASLAREGGLSSAIWAGPDSISRGVRQGTCSVEPQSGRLRVLSSALEAISTVVASIWAALHRLRGRLCLGLIPLSNASASGMGRSTVGVGPC